MYNTITKEMKAMVKRSEGKAKELKQKELIHVGDNLDIRKKARIETEDRSLYDIHLYNNLVCKVQSLRPLRSYLTHSWHNACEVT